MLSKLFPTVQFKKDTWEIDEFGGPSMFLLVGSERALLIDTGNGYGDLPGAVRMITDKPLTVVLTHAHSDHFGGAWQFGEAYMHPRDHELFRYRNNPNNSDGVGAFRKLAKDRRPMIAAKQRRAFGATNRAYEMFNLAGFDINVDVRDPDPDAPELVLHEVVDGQQFDLGGGRIVTAYDCPGHSPGEIVLLDESTRSLFAGDAINFNLGISSVPIETAVKYLERIYDMRDRYDGIYNGHHDFRALGAPLDDDCLPNIIDCCHQLLNGTASPALEPNFLGPDRPPKLMVRKGRNFLGFNPDNIFEKK